MVPGAGLEPARPIGQRILLTLYSFRCLAACAAIWGLDYLFALYRLISEYVGRGRLVSTLSPSPKHGGGLARDCHQPDLLRVPRI